MVISRIFASICVLLLGACTMGPEFQPPENADTPAAFDRHGVAIASARQPVSDRWWLMFKDPVLGGLVTRLLEQNLDIEAAATRIAQSRAQAGIAAADAFPQINGNASFTRQQPSEKGVISLLGGSGSSATQANGLGGRTGSSPDMGLSKPFNLWQDGFDASWEIDFWGRIRRRAESARASAEASESAKRLVQVSMIAELVRDYAQLRGTQAMLAITRSNLSIAQESAKLTNERAKGGLGNDLDYQNAEAQVETRRAQLEPLRQREAELSNQIGFLLGEFPGTLKAVLLRPRVMQMPSKPISIGRPGDLIRRRPDVQEAEAQLHAAVAQIGAAQADFLPRVTLAGSAGFQSLKFEDLNSWRSGTYSFGPSVTLPIFEGGRLMRTLELRTAQEQEAAITYRKTLLQAFHDVDNALIAIQSERRRFASLGGAVARNRAALGLANKRFKDGVVTFLDVLNTENNVLATEQQLADSRVNIATNYVALYKALGGGWQDTPSAAAAPQIAP